MLSYFKMASISKTLFIIGTLFSLVLCMLSIGAYLVPKLTETEDTTQPPPDTDPEPDEGTGEDDEEDDAQEDENQGESVTNEGDGTDTSDKLMKKPLVVKAYSTPDCSGQPFFSYEKIPDSYAKCNDLPANTPREIIDKSLCENSAEPTLLDDMQGTITYYSDDTGLPRELCCLETKNATVSGTKDGELISAHYSSEFGQFVPDQFINGKDVYIDSDDMHFTFDTEYEGVEEIFNCAKRFDLTWKANE